MARVPKLDDLDDLDDLEPRVDGGDEDDDLQFARSPARIALFFVFAAAVGGAALSAQSTSDFVAHLDRDVHAIHCSVVPGAGAQLGESGCRTVMLSPYSSFFRDQWWGGIPVALWSLAVFAFLAYRSGHLLWRGAPTRSEGFFLFASSLLPATMSVIFGYIAVMKVGAVCTVCTGIYAVSGIGCIAAAAAWAMSSVTPKGGGGPAPFALGCLEGTGFVAAMTFIFMAFSPMPPADAGRGAQGCGALPQPDDEAGVMFALSPTPGAAPSIEVLDPLCPACRAFATRLAASGFESALDLRAVLFPLDNECNWMVNESLHPGACIVSEAILCAAGLERRDRPERGRAVLDWAFSRQAELIDLARKDPAALRAMVEATFPEVRGCVGRPQVRNKLGKSLRWAVANALPVMTPQLFVDGTRLCDEDTDLGLEYTLMRMLEGKGRRAMSAAGRSAP